VTLRLVSYNIRYGGAGRAPDIAEVLAAAAPDVVIFEEASNPGVVEHVASAIGMAAWGRVTVSRSGTRAASRRST